MKTNENFGITVQAILDANTAQSLQESLNNLGDLKINLNVSGDIKSSDVSNEIGKYGTAVKETEKDVSGLSSAVDSLIGNVGKVAAWSMATNAIYGTKHAVEELFQDIVDIESKMIELERVTSNLDMSKMFDGAYESSQKYGAGLNDTLDAITEIGRSYSDLDEMQIIATSSAAVLASTIADMSGEDAVKTIIAVSNAYNLLIEDSELLIDKINEVDNNYSVSSDTISQALRKSSATANTFGVELNDLIGYITAISATTQESGNVIGNSIKTILSRLTTLSEAESVLKGVNVSIRDVSGEMRDSSDILGELASKWSTLTEEEKQNLGVQIAGRNQLTRFLALMDNYNMALDASTTAMTSQGSALRENIIYGESYEAKLKKLENSQLALSKAIGESTVESLGKSLLDFRIILTDLGTAYFKTVDATVIFVASMGALILALSKTASGKKVLTGILRVFTTEAKAAEIQTKMFNTSLTQLGNTTTKVSANMSKLNGSFNVTRTGMVGTAKGLKDISLSAQAIPTTYGVATVATKGLAVASSMLSAALKAIPMMLIVSVIGFAVKALDNWTKGIVENNRMQKAQNENIINNKRNIEELKKAYQDAAGVIDNSFTNEQEKQEALDSQKRSLEGLIASYPKLKKQLEDENLSWTKKVELMREADELAEKGLKRDIERLEKARKLALQDKTHGRSESIGYGREDELGTRKDPTSTFDSSRAKEAINDEINKKLSLIEANRELTQSEIEYVRAAKESILSNAATREQFVLAQENIEELISVYKNAGSQGIEPFKEALLSSGYTAEQVAIIVENVTNAVEDFGDESEFTMGKAASGIEEFNKSSGDSLNEFFGVVDGTTEAIDKMIQYINLFGDESNITKSAAESLAGSLSIMGLQAFNSGEELLKNKDALLAMSETLKIAQSNEMAYSEAVSKGIVYVSKGRKQAFIDFQTNKLEELKAEKASLETKISNAELEIKSIQEPSKAKSNAVNKEKTILEKSIGNWSKYEGDILKINKNIAKSIEGKDVSKTKTSSYSSVDAALDSRESNLADLRSQLANVNSEISRVSNLKFVETTLDSFKKSTSASGSGKRKTYFDYLNERLDVFKNNLKSLDLELAIVQEKFKGLNEGSPEWFANLKQQEDIIKRRQKATLDYANAIRSELNSTKLSNDERVELNNLLQQQTLEYEKQNSALDNLIKTQENYYKSQIKDKIKTLKDLEKKRHKEAIENIKKEREEFKKAIDNQISQIKRVEDSRKYDKELEKLQSEKQSIQDQINRLQGDNSRLANSKRLELAKELADIEDKIYEHQLDRQNELREESLKDLEKQKMEELDIVEEAEKKKSELILSDLDERVDALDNLNLTLSQLNKQMSELSKILNDFPSWSDTFNAVSGVQSLSNILGAAPFTMATSNKNPQSSQSFVINVTANSKEEGQEAGKAIVDELMKSGLIISGNSL